MQLSLFSVLRYGASHRLSLRSLQRFFEPKELEDMGLWPAELSILAARGRRPRIAELFYLNPTKIPTAPHPWL